MIPAFGRASYWFRIDVYKNKVCFNLDIIWVSDLFPQVCGINTRITSALTSILFTLICVCVCVYKTLFTRSGKKANIDEKMTNLLSNLNHSKDYLAWNVNSLEIKKPWEEEGILKTDM